MKYPRELSDEELAAFREAVADVRPLADDGRIEPQHRRPRPTPRMSRRDEEQVIEELFSDEYHPLGVEAGEEIWFARPGLQHNVMRKLRRGQYAVGAELDLHGLTVELARRELAEFLLAALARGMRCVRVIHGKGRRSSAKGPILKGKVDRWLRQRDEVLAYCSARPVDGGTGALYVLLRRT
ncbi:Smr/MutS family protein [Endothiovibrio diazotrophicus]